jgi:ribosomal protein L32
VNCKYDPTTAKGAIGMFHCPECGEMVLAGCPHPNYDLVYYTYDEVIKQRKPFNRAKYKDGWYYIDDRGHVCSLTDLSIRNPNFTEEDKNATDWIVKED